MHQNNQVMEETKLNPVYMEKVINHKKAKIIHKDDSKGQVLFMIGGIFDEPVAYVKVVNSTQEPDGSYKDYYLCVPPTCKTCSEAVSWTFGLTADSYRPEQETQAAIKK